MAGYNDEDEFEDEEDLRILTMIDVDSYPQMATATSGNGPNWGRPEGQPTYKVESPRAAVDSGQHLRSRQNSGIHSTGIQQRHEMPYRGDPMQARDQWGRNAPVVATDVTFTERQIVGADFMHPPESTELQELRVRLRQAEDENQRLQVENKRMRYEKDGGLKIFEQRNLELERRIVDLQNQQRAHQTTIEKQFKEQLTYKEEEVNRLRTELLFEQKEKVNLEFDRTQVLVQTKRERGPTQHPIHSSFFEEIDMSAITENQHLPVSSQHSMEEPSNDISMDILPESILVTDENEVNSAKTGSTVTPLQRELIVEETPALLFIRHLLADTVTDVKAPVFALRTGPLLESQLIESLNRLSSAVNEESSLYPSYRKAVARLATNLRSLMVDPTLSLDVLVKDVDVLLEYSLTMKQFATVTYIMRMIYILTRYSEESRTLLLEKGERGMSCRRQLGKCLTSIVSQFKDDSLPWGEYHLPTSTYLFGALTVLATSVEQAELAGFREIFLPNMMHWFVDTRQSWELTVLFLDFWVFLIPDVWFADMLLKPPELNMLSALQLASKLLRPKDDKPVRLKTSVSRVICALAEIHPKVLETITRSRVGNSNLMDFVVAHTHSEFRQLTAGLRHQQALDTSDHLRCTTFHALVRLLYRIVCHRGLRLEVADTDGVSLTIKNATRHLLMAMLVRLARMRESEWDALAVLAREVLQHVDDKPDIHADN